MHSLARFPDHPQIVRVFKFIACDLLLVAGASPVRILERVELFV